jgi:hypothetical protein
VTICSAGKRPHWVSTSGWLAAGVRPRARRRLEQHVVAGVRVERRVEADQVDAGVGDVLAQHLEVVAVIERLVIATPCADT